MSKSQEVASKEEGQQPTIPNLQVQALLGEMRKMLRTEMEMVHERIDRIENTQIEQSNNAPTRRRRRIQPREARVEDDESYDGGFEDDDDWDPMAANRRYGGRIREGRNGEDNNISSIKMKIPSFQGKNDPEAYLEWEKKVELVFDCHNYSEMKKVKLAAIEFSDYAIVWWDQLMLNRRRNRERPIARGKR
ncbi:hypothetical protein LguiB_026843 [Lonicera macranthoides]